MMQLVELILTQLIYNINLDAFFIIDVLIKYIKEYLDKKCNHGQQNTKR